MALCKNPLNLKKAGGIVPCGDCFTCRINKARFWTLRIMLEARLSSATWWTTLTYNKEFLPDHYIDPNTGQIFEHGEGTLNFQHIDLFVKRVRKRLPPRSFRTLIVGEYGDQDNRPHYHVCVFGYGEEIQRVLESCWTDPISKRSLGFVDRKKCRPLDTPTARYTVGYTIKKLTKKNDELLEGRYPEGIIYNSEGIGVGFAKRYADAMRSVSGASHIFNVMDIPRFVRFDGKNWPLDRYLRQKILKELGITNVILEAGQKRFKKEMQALSRRAELNPKFSKAKVITPYILEQQYRLENAQRILNTETRAKLYMKDKPL